jgi:hypothetical protein
VRLTAEQELQVRQTIAARVKALSGPQTTSKKSPFEDGWDEAIAEAVVEIMGGDPIYVRTWSDHTPAVPNQRPESVKRKDGTSAPVEDVYGIDAY